jgi:hypothetical protein
VGFLFLEWQADQENSHGSLHGPEFSPWALTKRACKAGALQDAQAPRPVYLIRANMIAKLPFSEERQF